MKKRETGAFRLKEHYCCWTKKEKFSVLHVLLYVDSFEPWDEPCYDEYFTASTVKECSQAFRNWLSVPSNLKPYQDERFEAQM